MNNLRSPAVRRQSGFTMIEMVVVLLLMGIVAATVLGRSITTTDLDLNSETDKIRNHLRYAQAQAMKRSDKVWGIQFEVGQYWLFRGSNPNDVNEQVRFPGVDYAVSSNKVALPSSLSLSTNLTGNVVFFDRIGKPYNPNPTTELNLQGRVTVAGAPPITITPETGLIR
jgi:prepilin-type N-terminal cleavage/methylation domain-containing protein